MSIENYDDLYPNLNQFEDNLKDNIPPFPHNWTQPRMAERFNLPWLLDCSMTLFSPESDSYLEMKKELAMFKYDLHQNAQYIDSSHYPYIAEGERIPLLAFDTETTGLNTRVQYDIDGNLIHNVKIVGLCLAINENNGFYLPVRHTEEDGYRNWDAQAIVEFMDELQEEFCLLIHNAQYDREVISIEGCYKHRPCPYFFDTQILLWQENVNMSLSESKLELVSERLLGRRGLPTYALFEEVKTGDKSTSIRFNRLPASHAFVYGCQDAVNTFGVFKHIISNDRSVLITQPLPVKIDHKMVDALRLMYRHGIPVNLRYAINCAKECLWRAKLVKDFINQSAGYPVKIESPQEVSKLLFCKLRLIKDVHMTFHEDTLQIKELDVDELKRKYHYIKVNKTQFFSVDEKTISALHSQFPDCDILDKIVLYRKLLNTFSKMYKKMITNSYLCHFLPYSKIQPQLSLVSTDTGRLSSTCNSRPPKYSATKLSTKGDPICKYMNGSGDAGLNVQGIDSKDPFTLFPVKRIKSIPLQACVNPDYPYSEEMDDLFLSKLPLHNLKGV